MQADLILAKWNQPSIDFYEKYLHATPQDEWLGMRLEVEGIENLKNITTRGLRDDAQPR